jgi:hypothetical protein
VAARARPAQPASDVEAFVARYTPEMAAAIEACRHTLRARVGAGCELVYDNYNALVFAYAPIDKASQATLSIAAYPGWIRLFFLHGLSLADPESLLEGSGSQIRSVRLKSPADLDSPGVRALIERALALQAAAYAKAAAMTTVVKSVAGRQRPRRQAGPAA